MAGGTLGGGKPRRMITDINVIPLVDIMLVLLIIFMVTTTTLVHDSLQVKLPEAATGKKATPTLVAVVIDAERNLFLNGTRATEQQIRSFIRSQRGRDELEAIISADRRVQHGEVVRIIDLVRTEGVTKFAIHVLRKEEK